MTTINTLLPFTQRDANLPLYLQVAAWIEENIATKRLAPYAKLPTVRAMATHLGVNRGSVASAYSHLAAAGKLYARVGKGTFVQSTNESDGAQDLAANQSEKFWDSILLRSSNRLGLQSTLTSTDAGPGAVWIPDRGEALPDALHFPLDMPLADPALSHQLIQKAARDVVDSLDKKALSYSHPQGLHSLRVCISELANKRSIKVQPHEIMITNGAQQAFSLVTTLLVQPGDVVVTSNPTYPGAIRAFNMAKANIIGVPVDHDGMRVDLLENIITSHKPRLIYTIPSFHTPTGSTLSPERRKALYSISIKHNIPIIEDEYVNDLYYGDPPPAPIKALDQQKSIIYVGTFSKTLGASMRLGWIGAHPSLISQLIQIKEMHDIHSSIFSQLIVERILKEGLYEPLLSKLRKHYGHRYNLMASKMRDRLGMTLPNYRSVGGFSIWAKPPAHISPDDWLVYARTRGVPFEDGSSYFLQPEPKADFVKFCFSLLSMADIEKAIDVLDISLHELALHNTKRRSPANRFIPFV